MHHRLLIAVTPRAMAGRLCYARTEQPLKSSGFNEEASCPSLTIHH
jgi:hypothetical protein